MASQLTGREKKDDNVFHSASMQRNSKIPIRLTRLTSGNHKRFSLEDKTAIKRPLPRDSAKDRSSRIPVAVVKKKDSAEKTGASLNDGHRKQAQVKPNSPTKSKRLRSEPLRSLNKQVRPQTSRQLTSVESKEKPKNEKEYCALQGTGNDITDIDALSCERKDDSTPGLNTDVEVGGLIMQAHTTTSACGPQDDFKSNSSFSVDDQDMTMVAKERREALKEERCDCDENKKESSYHQQKLEEDSGRGSFEDICIAIAPCIGKTSIEDTRVLDVQDEAEFDNISEKGADDGEDSWDALDDIRLRCSHSGSCGSCLNGDVCMVLRDMDIKSPVVELHEKENEKLVDQGALKKKEIEEVQSGSLQTEIEALRLELKRLNSNEEYRERAFTNLREAIKKKDGQLKDLKDEMDYAQMEKNYYLYQIELLENELKDREESKENLRFEYDELRVIFDESKEKKDCEDNFAEMEKTYYLYQIELLENKLKDSEESKENIRFECDELRVIVDELKEKKDGEDNFAEMEKRYYPYQIELLENKLKDSEESKENLRFECDELRVIVDELKEKKDGEDNFAEMEKSYYLYQIELLEVKLKESKESNELLQFECDEAREMLKDLKETTRRINSENTDYGYLREEVELLKGSLELGKNREEGLKSQLKCLEDELEKFRNKNKQIEVIYETPNVTIYKEKGKMALELSKTSDEENVEFKELLKQIEELTEKNKYLQETLITKTQAVDEEENPETILDAKQKKFKSGIKKLKKRIRLNQREIERVGMFAWQRGCDTRDSALWMSLLKEERKELAYVRNSLKLQTQTSRDKERELESSKQHLQQKETELVQAQEGLRRVSETAGALQNIVELIVDFLGKLDAAIKSLCRRYTQSTQSLMMKKETALRETEVVLTDSSPTDASSRPLTWAALDAQARDLRHETSTLRYSESPSPNQPSIVSSERDMTVRDWIPPRTDDSENYFLSLLSFK